MRPTTLNRRTFLQGTGAAIGLALTHLRITPAVASAE
ncbi:MAG: twin-arginine translocation signal domain-containing protein, partial [bacterium]|nr:twin-arginine translocation signal domain-containing protein [bacterium]